VRSIHRECFTTSRLPIREYSRMETGHNLLDQVVQPCSLIDSGLVTRLIKHLVVGEMLLDVILAGDPHRCTILNLEVGRASYASLLLLLK
jgi:hypothetical protein